MGDIPIYVAHDSADVWANQDLFQLDGTGRPTAVAGVPPDYFSATGQLWGNPLYRWDRLEEEGYAWWIARIRSCLASCDLLRIDHFRAFAAYWSIPAVEKTALRGRWVPGPGRRLFDAARAALGPLPILAEDLGDISPDVRALLDELGFPGMKVLQFAFYGADSEYLPHRHTPNAVVYTGTHDNDTARGWYAALKPEERERVFDYLGCDGRDIEWALIRAAYGSVAERAIVPLQDVLGLGSEARMNTPSEPADNWGWRAPADAWRPGARGAAAADGDPRAGFRLDERKWLSSSRREKSPERSEGGGSRRGSRSERKGSGVRSSPFGRAERHCVARRRCAAATQIPSERRRRLVRICQEHRQKRADDRDHERAEDRGPASLDVEVQPERPGERARQPEHQAVDDEGEEPERQDDDRKRQQLEDGPDERVDDAEDERDGEERDPVFGRVRDAVDDLDRDPEGGGVDEQSHAESAWRRPPSECGSIATDQTPGGR